MAIAEYEAPWVPLSDRELCREVRQLAERMAVQECQWLELLVEFDLRKAWADDGQLSAVDWLVWRCGMCRSTAKEKLRVAHELRRRPLLKDAFASGALSYSKVRAITRVTDVDEETDRWLLHLAESGTTADLERVARHYELLREQERGVDDYLARFDRRGLRTSRTYDGMMVVEVVLPVEDGEELMGAIREVAESDRPVDKVSAEATGWTQRRADALLDIVRGARGGGDERYTLHVVAEIDDFHKRVSAAKTVEGDAINPDMLRRVACDAGIVRHLMRGASVPLDVGTRTRVWTPGQRRAIQLRDEGHCRFPGCWRRTCDIHHIWHHADGGPTAVDNGVLLCRRHHTVLHEQGFTMRSDFSVMRPDGTPLTPSRDTSAPTPPAECARHR